MGLNLTLLAHNVYMLPKLAYISQLRGSPTNWKEIEAWAAQRLLPGPHRWMPPAVAQCLRDELGMDSQMASLTTAGPAAQLRVAATGGDGRQSLRTAATARSIEEARRTTTAWDLEWRWSSWFSGGPAQRLQQNMQDLQRSGINVSTAINYELGQAARPVTMQRWQRAHGQLQRAATAMLRQRLWHREGTWQVRRRIQKWPAPMAIGHRVRACSRVMKLLKKHTAPRIRAAVIRTWFDGWCTARRFGSSAACRFGCRHGEDRVLHYLSCGRLWDFGRKHLQLEVPNSAEARRTAALLWEAGASRERLAKLATMLAVGYRAHNTLRHWRGPPLHPARLLVAAAREMAGCSGDD